MKEGTVEILCIEIILLIKIFLVFKNVLLIEMFLIFQKFDVMMLIKIQTCKIILI